MDNIWIDVAHCNIVIYDLHSGGEKSLNIVPFENIYAEE